MNKFLSPIKMKTHHKDHSQIFYVKSKAAFHLISIKNNQIIQTFSEICMFSLIN